MQLAPQTTNALWCILKPKIEWVRGGSQTNNIRKEGMACSLAVPFLYL